MEYVDWVPVAFAACSEVPVSIGARFTGYVKLGAESAKMAGMLGCRCTGSEALMPAAWRAADTWGVILEGGECDVRADRLAR
jgi:hypothetical protein